jgi:hypothetical protein
MAVGLTALAAGLAFLFLWVLWGPDPVDSPSKSPERSTPDTDPVPDPVFALAKFRLERHLLRKFLVCEECNGTVIVWTDDPSRPGAKLGICRRCARVRFDASQGQVLSL